MVPPAVLTAAGRDFQRVAGRCLGVGNRPEQPDQRRQRTDSMIGLQRKLVHLHPDRLKHR